MSVVGLSGAVLTAREQHEHRNTAQTLAHFDPSCLQSSRRNLTCPTSGSNRRQQGVRSLLRTAQNNCWKKTTHALGKSMVSLRRSSLDVHELAHSWKGTKRRVHESCLTIRIRRAWAKAGYPRVTAAGGRCGCQTKPFEWARISAEGLRAGRWSVQGDL